MKKENEVRLNKQQVKKINNTKLEYYVGQTLFKVEKDYGSKEYVINEITISSIDFILRYTEYSLDPIPVVKYAYGYNSFSPNEHEIYTTYAEAQDAILNKLRKKKEQKELESGVWCENN